MDIGVEFSHYRVIEHIGRGGMADVWSARDKRLNRTVAIKTIARNLTDSEEVNPVALFEREAHTIAQLEHPHILPIYDFGEYEEQLYIVMRYITGGSLEDQLAAGPMPAQEVLRHARGVAQALDYAHANNVVHLDLKPSNILLDSQHSPYLADFGLAAKLSPEGRAANPGYGTLLYMAPEQLTSSEIDHRADIYSFTILLFHMITGEMPFDATTSLALKQIQFQEDLPELEKLELDLAEALTPVLRRGTALDPNTRPNTVGELVNQVETALNAVGAVGMSMAAADESFVGAITVDLSNVITELDPEAITRQEALDIFERARRAWAHGQGRFLLGISHFMVMNDAYMNAETLGLELDEDGMQMLLRGALEYDHEVDYWWEKLDNESRRWVALHAVRSESAPARTRALYRLETLPDSDPPRIAPNVAQALQIEVNEDARRAAIQVLGTRAQLTHADGLSIQAKDLEGKLLTVRTRTGIQLNAPSEWRDIVFTPEIDHLLADIALDQGDPQTAELAARTVGRIRSVSAVRAIANAQQGGQAGALRALALVRDEAPSLPPIVSSQGRLYAWLTNTWRRISDDPLHNVWRYVLALIGGAVAMGAQVFITYRSEAIFNADRWGDTISIGLTFGFFMGFMALLVGEIPARLRGFWPSWARLAATSIIGFLWGTLTWAAFTWFFLNYVPDWGVMVFAGVGTAVGFALTAILNLPGWLAFLVTGVATYLPIYTMFNAFWNGELASFIQSIFIITPGNAPALLYYDYPEQIFSVAIPVVILIALGAHAQALWGDVRRLISRVRGTR
ncbi:MAG: protein kinase [Anaerolineaceae bacterium]|nr:protein kinase [Anaerolineaceae bacterium]